MQKYAGSRTGSVAFRQRLLGKAYAKTCRVSYDMFRNILHRTAYAEMVLIECVRMYRNLIKK